MTKAELIEKLQKGAGKNLSKKALGEIVDEVFALISKSVKKDKRFVYPGFGTFSVKKRAARMGRNPRTNTPVPIPVTKTIIFKPAPNLKSSL